MSSYIFSFLLCLTFNFSPLSLQQETLTSCFFCLSLIDFCVEPALCLSCKMSLQLLSFVLWWKPIAFCHPLSTNHFGKLKLYLCFVLFFSVSFTSHSDQAFMGTDPGQLLWVRSRLKLTSKPNSIGLRNWFMVRNIKLLGPVESGSDFCYSVKVSGYRRKNLVCYRSRSKSIKKKKTQQSKTKQKHQINQI